MVPLDRLPLPVHLSFMHGHYWAGMKANWIILIHQYGSPWRLVDIYTQQEITLPSLDTAAIEHRGRRTLLPTTHETCQAFGSTSICKKL